MRNRLCLGRTARSSAVKRLVPKHPDAIRFVVADPHPLLLAGIKVALAEAAKTTLVGATHAASEVLELVRITSPDVVLLDIGFCALDDYWCLRQIRAEFPGTKVVVLSSSAQAPELREAFARGASAFVLKTIDPDDLADAIRRAATATVFAPFGPPPPTASAIGKAGLTRRETEVLRALCEGASNQEIALALTVSDGTVKYHLSNVYRKLGVKGRAGAVRWTYERGVRLFPQDRDHSAGVEGRS
jgi:DNA-binding NarL/FixJ family response regulator